MARKLAIIALRVAAGVVRMRVATVAVLLGSMVAIATAPAATGARPKPTSLILFNVPYEVEGGPAFGVVRPDGKGRRILGRGTYYAPRWSPDGRQIAAYGGPTGLAILDDKGRLARALPRPYGVFSDAGWSPDGRWLAGFIPRCEHGYCGDLHLIRTDGGEERTLVRDAFPLSSYDWAPGGGALAYSGGFGRPGVSGIVIVSLTGRTVTHPAFRNGSDPTWAPDGRRLSFTRGKHLYLARRDGSGLRRLTSGREESSPSWSPDGRRIAYRRAVSGGATAIAVLDLQRSRVTQIAKLASDVPLIWSPDGARLAWSDSYRGSKYVFVARADGRGRARPITIGEFPDWR